MHATDGIRPVAPARTFVHNLPLAEVALTSTGIALFVAVFLLLRRASGAIPSPLPVRELVITAAVLLTWSVMVRAVLELKLRPVLAWMLPLAVILLFAVACSYPGNRLIDWLTWFPVVAALVIADRAQKIAGLPRSPVAANRTRLAILTETDDDQIAQQLTRYRTTAGQDVIRGTLAAAFATGERTSTLHVAFCPPFERLPDIELEVAEGSSATAKLVQVLHNGMQLEVRLAKPAQMPRRLLLEFFAAEPVDMA